MKTKKIMLVIFVSTIAFGCKEKKEPIEDIVKEYSVSRLPNMSDEHFSQALTNLEQNKGKEAAEHISKGIAELEKEGKDVSGLYKTNLEKAMQALKHIETDLKNDKNVSTTSLREMIVNAEINIAHEYLSTSDFYVLDEPEQAANRTTEKQFNNHLSKLKEEEGKMKDESKKKGTALLNEGKKLEAEYQAWQKKAAEFTKRSGDHIKKYYPEYYVEGYWLN